MLESSETWGTFIFLYLQKIKTTCENFLNNVIISTYDTNNRKVSLVLKLRLLISTLNELPHWLWKQRVFIAHHCSRNVLEKIECVIWPKACQLEQELQMWGLVRKLRYITFLAVNYEVPFLIACCYGVDYAVPIWVFGQNCGDEGVGACVLWNKCSISAKRISSITSVRK